MNSKYAKEEVKPMATLRQILPHDAELLDGTWDVGVTSDGTEGYRVDAPARWNAQVGAYVELEQVGYKATSLTEIEGYLTTQGIPLEGWSKFHPEDTDEWTCDCDPRLETTQDLQQDEPGRIPNLNNERQFQRLVIALQMAKDTGKNVEEVIRWLESSQDPAVKMRHHIEEVARAEWRRKRGMDRE
jgi:hypothetical protein